MENKSTQWEGIIEGKRCRIDYDVAEIFAQGQWIEAQGDDELEIYKAAWKDATTTDEFHATCWKLAEDARKQA